MTGRTAEPEAANRAASTVIEQVDDAARRHTNSCRASITCVPLNGHPSLSVPNGKINLCCALSRRELATTASFSKAAVIARYRRGLPAAAASLILTL